MINYTHLKKRHLKMNNTINKTSIAMQICKLAKKFQLKLKTQMQNRDREMQLDDNSHRLIYKILGISEMEGERVDIYQNRGRFLYKYAGAFLEEATTLCFKSKFENATKCKIQNKFSEKPKTFEIDCLVRLDAHEFKWREATTDGDHITKEKMRILSIKEHGYKPIRVVFYYPQRSQAQNIQKTLKELYNNVGGEYYCGYEAWRYVQKYTGVNLLEILKNIANLRSEQ